MEIFTSTETTVVVLQILGLEFINIPLALRLFNVILLMIQVKIGHFVPILNSDSI